MNHQVFIEGCRDVSPAAMRKLATAVGQRYQVDPAQILARVQKGRFRVKANLALTEAQSFMAYLESIGALCSIVDGQGRVVKRSRIHTPPPIPSAPVKELIPEGPLRLAMLDEDSSEALSPSIADTGDGDAFLPPEIHSESELELVVQSQSKAVSTVEPIPLASAPTQPASTTLASQKRSALRVAASSEPTRLAVGVFLALLVGFIASSSLGSSLEKRRYASAVGELKAVYLAVDSAEAWNELDTLRTTTIETLERRRKNVVITSVLLWLAVSGCLLWLWLRLIPWNRVTPSHHQT